MSKAHTTKENKEEIAIGVRVEITKARDALNRARDGLSIEAELGSGSAYTFRQLAAALNAWLSAYLTLKTGKAPKNFAKSCPGTTEAIIKILDMAVSELEDDAPVPKNGDPNA